MTHPEGFIIEGQVLKKTFEFKSYLKNISFVNAIAWEANKQGHHPDLLVTFNKCTVMLTTHDANHSITEKDLKLANQINDLFNSEK